ncbi:MAG: MerR family transcriptional regulator [Flavobacteriales bacterium]|nr:MerR family transcriptional regulator [Flavobacteriales bacterium]
MESKELINIKSIILYHKVDEDFISQVESFQLIDIIIKDTDKYIHTKQLPVLERVIRLHYELKVNMEGIDVIGNMMDKMEDMKERIRKLECRLKLYE